MVLCCTMSSHIIHTLLLYLCVLFVSCLSPFFFFFLFFLFSFFFFFFKIKKKKPNSERLFFNCFSCTSKKVKNQKHHVCACPEASFRVHWLLLPFLVFCFLFFLFFCQNKILKNATFLNCLMVFFRKPETIMCLPWSLLVSFYSSSFCFCLCLLLFKKEKKGNFAPIILWAELFACPEVPCSALTHFHFYIFHHI